jgi:hypothetical protein
VHVHGGQYPVGLALLKSGPAVTYLGAGESRVRLRQFRVRHGRAGHTRPVSPLFSYEADLGVATNARGAQALAWSRELGSTAPVYAGVRSAGGRFHVRRISRQTPAFAPLVAIARSGAALVAWNTPSDKIFAVSRRPGQRFGLARRFGSLPRGARVSDLQIAVDSLGRAVIGWVQSSPGRDEHAFGGFRTAAGRLLQRHDLGRADNLGNQGTAAFDAHGRARLIWRRAAAVSAVRARFP